MHVRLQDKPLQSIDSALSIIFVTAGMIEGHPLQATLELAGFKGKQDQVCALHEKEVVICGTEALDTDSLRSAAAAVVKTLSGFQYKSAKLHAYAPEICAAITEGFLLGGYTFERYKSESQPAALEAIIFSTEGIDGKAVSAETLQKAIDEATIIANATNFTRTLVNTTPDDMTPQKLAEAAQALSNENQLECTVLDEALLAEEKMNAMLSVGRASAHPPRLIHVAYKPKNPTHTVSLIGKGLTYDSGGLSLKPSTSMVTMKMDKAGACAVLGMLKAVSELKLDVEVHGFIGAAENMVSANAYKPDDVLEARNGKTIEVRNTDAEGRLVLADVLCYAQDNVQADYLFDFATLTGACMVALGPYTTGIMGHNDALKQQVETAARRSGELVGALPFNPHLKKLIKSEIADVCNIGSKPYGGAITAALFLDHFITDGMKEKWVHFDIAGPAYTESPWDCNPFGGTGAGVRMGTQFIQSLTK